MPQQPGDDFDARMNFSGFDAQGRGDFLQSVRNLFVVDVDSDSHRYKMNLILLGIHFGEDAAEFFPAEHRVVGPSQVGYETGLFDNCIADGEAGDQGDHRRLLRRDPRAQKQRHVNAVGFFGVPGVPGAAAACGLFFGDDQGAVWLSLFPQKHRNGVRGIGLKEMMDLFSERALRQSLTQDFWNENIGHFLDLIASAGVAFHADAQRAKFFDPAEDSRACDADFAGDFRAADDDHGVVGEKGEERVDAAIGGPGKICGIHLWWHRLQPVFSRFPSMPKKNQNPQAEVCATPLQIFFELRQPLADFGKFHLPFGERRFQALHNVLGRFASKRLVSQARLIGRNHRCEAVQFLAQAGDFGFYIERRIEADKEFEISRGADGALR